MKTGEGETGDKTKEAIGEEKETKGKDGVRHLKQ